jgi:uncharacterized protein
MDPAGGHFHLFDAGNRDLHVLVADGSQVYTLDRQASLLFAAANEIGESAVLELLDAHGLGGKRFLGTRPPKEVPIRALSLAVAQRCNLGCHYCYAEGGGFGSAGKDMSPQIAEASVRRLLAAAEPGERVNLAFMGGEPLINRKLVHDTTELAARLAEQKGVAIGFSITTNGTLLSSADGNLFDRFGFSVTVSLDGVGSVHDKLRPAKGGRGTYERIIANVAGILQTRLRCKVYARVTVTPENLHLREALDEFVALGFDGVGFAPMLRAPSGRGEMRTAHFDRLLEELIECGREFERRIACDQPYPFSNMASALEEIHRGTHRPYPCGAGGGYFGASADGELFACHRFVGDQAFKMGDVAGGVDKRRQETWLAERMVDKQEPCRTCWARYLCGGGCHYDAIHRGRPACTFIRGWLDYALGAYVRLSAARPDIVNGALGAGPRFPLPQPVT